MRKIFAFICGMLAGLLLSSSLTSGLHYRFQSEISLTPWGILFWGEHWFIRAVASCICAAWAGFIAGTISRSKGNIVGMLAVFPSWIVWTIALYAGIVGHIPFVGPEIYISIGNKLFTFIVLIVLFPIAWFSGLAGEETGKEYAEHFDSRPHTLLGIKWYHYLWIPIILNLIVMQGGYAGLYFLTWVKASYKVGPFNTLGMLITAIPTILIFLTLWLMYTGVVRSYKILAGFENVESKWRAFMLILKYAIGFQLLAALAESGIEMAHYYLAKALT